MFIHIFAFRWKPGVADARKAEAAAAIRAFQGQIPDLLSTSIGTSVSPNSQGYELTGVMHFPTQAAFEAYMTHPAHQALVGWLLPLIAPIEFDFEA